MSSNTINEMTERAHKIIRLYQCLTGRKIIPQNTTINRTYQYRYALKFAELTKELPWDTIQKIIYHAIEYSKEHKKTSLWTRGLWILTKSDIIDIVYNRIKKHEEIKSNELHRLKQSKQFVKSHDYKLIDVETKGGFSNIVKWYNNNDITLTYIAMSESCKLALSKISYVDRSMLPSDKIILLTRVKCMVNKEFNDKVLAILGNDYIKIRDHNKTK